MLFLFLIGPYIALNVNASDGTRKAVKTAQAINLNGKVSVNPTNGIICSVSNDWTIFIFPNQMPVEEIKKIVQDKINSGLRLVDSAEAAEFVEMNPVLSSGKGWYITTMPCCEYFETFFILFIFFTFIKYYLIMSYLLI